MGGYGFGAWMDRSKAIRANGQAGFNRRSDINGKQIIIKHYTPGSSFIYPSFPLPNSFLLQRH
jgi:hypothetical protein